MLAILGTRVLIEYSKRGTFRNKSGHSEAFDYRDSTWNSVEVVFYVVALRTPAKG